MPATTHDENLERAFRTFFRSCCMRMFRHWLRCLLM